MKANILILGVGAAGVGEQIVKSLRLQDQINLNIIGTDIYHNSYGKYLVDKFYLVPSATSAGYFSALKEIITENDIDFIFHGSDAEMNFLNKNRAFFKENNIGLSINSVEVINLCQNKFNTFQALNKTGISLPEYKRIKNLDDIKGIDFFPIILKPNTGSGGSAGVNIAFDYKETELYVTLMLSQGIDIIAQSYKGDSNSEYTIGVSSSQNGEVLGSICLKRDLSSALSTRSKFKKNNKDYVISSGISQGWICHNQNLQNQAEIIAKSINSKGPLNIQGREVDGNLFLMEINPRLSGTSFIRALAGYNEPLALLKINLLELDYSFTFQDLYVGRSINEKIFK